LNEALHSPFCPLLLGPNGHSSEAETYAERIHTSNEPEDKSARLSLYWQQAVDYIDCKLHGRVSAIHGHTGPSHPSVLLRSKEQRHICEILRLPNSSERMVSLNPRRYFFIFPYACCHGTLRIYMRRKQPLSICCVLNLHPGQMALTCTRCGAKSSAATFVIPVTVCFDAL